MTNHKTSFSADVVDWALAREMIGGRGKGGSEWSRGKGVVGGGG